MSDAGPHNPSHDPTPTKRLRASTVASGCLAASLVLVFFLAVIFGIARALFGDDATVVRRIGKPAVVEAVPAGRATPPSPTAARFVATSSLYEVRTDVSQAVAEQTTALLERLYSELVERFGRAPKIASGRRFSVSVYAIPADFCRAVPSVAGNAGFADFEGPVHLIHTPLPGEYRRVVIHEAVHQYVFALQRENGAREGPTWWCEGVCHELERHMFTEHALELGVESCEHYWNWWERVVWALDRADLVRLIEDRSVRLDNESERALGRAIIAYFVRGPGRRSAEWFKKLEERILAGKSRARLFAELGVSEKELKEEIALYARDRIRIGKEDFGEWTVGPGAEATALVGSGHELMRFLGDFGVGGPRGASFRLPAVLDRGLRSGFCFAFRKHTRYRFVRFEPRRGAVEWGEHVDGNAVTAGSIEVETDPDSRLGIDLGDADARITLDGRVLAVIDLTEEEAALPFGLLATRSRRLPFDVYRSEEPLGANAVPFKDIEVSGAARKGR